MDESTNYIMEADYKQNVYVEFNCFTEDRRSKTIFTELFWIQALSEKTSMLNKMNCYCVHIELMHSHKKSAVDVFIVQKVYTKGKYYRIWEVGD